MNKDMELNRSATSQLIVNNGMSMYKPQTSEQPDIRTGEEEGRVGNVNMRGNITTQITTANTQTFKNHLDKIIVTQFSFDGKEYLIEEPLTEYKWNIRRNRREISGFQCVQATTRTRDGTNVVAWYTPDIPVSDGPSSYRGLPGLILYLEINQNNGSRVFSCTSIEHVDEMPDIELPDKGEKISRTEFDKMMRERVETMQRRNAESGRSGGTVIIR